MPLSSLRSMLLLALLSAGLLILVQADGANAAEPFRFEDVTASSGIAAELETHPDRRPWRYAHGAAWGDVDISGRPALFVGAFAARQYYTGDDSPIPNMLFVPRGDGFVRLAQESLEARQANARCAGACFADLDGDGDLDLVVTNHVQKAGHGTTRLFENLGEGRFRDVTPDAAPWTTPLGMRNVAFVDVTRNGRLDIILTDGSYGRDAVAKARLIVLENRGGFQFEDISARLGLPDSGVTGLGLAIGDVNDDGWPDLFVAGSNRLFVSDGRGRFREAHPGRFALPPADVSEGLHCGAAFGDLDGDGLLDLVTTEHGVPARIHVWHNRGIRDGVPDLVEVSKEVGFGDDLPRGTKPMPIKTAHIALRDVDNDGRLDIMTTLLARNAQGVVYPVVIGNRTTRPGKISLAPLPREELFGYQAPGPAADYDRDGRVDIFLPSWFEELPNYLFRNVTEGGRWLTVRVTRGEGLADKFNSLGIGAVVRAYKPGHAGEREHLIARADLTIGNGYASGEEALAHLGLGKNSTCDLVVAWQGKEIVQRDVAADRLLEVRFE